VSLREKNNLIAANVGDVTEEFARDGSAREWEKVK
jgi:hypothetical protein